MLSRVQDIEHGFLNHDYKLIQFDSIMHDLSRNLHDFNEILPRLMYYINFKYEFLNAFMCLFNYEEVDIFSHGYLYMISN